MNDNLGMAVILTDKKQKLLIRFLGFLSPKLRNLIQISDDKDYLFQISVFQKMICNFVNHFGT